MEMFFSLGFEPNATWSKLEMTQEKPVSLTIKREDQTILVINIIAYSEYDSEVELMNNRKVICHEYA